MGGLELNKIAAAILLAGLIAMLAGTAADILYHPDLHPEKRGYQIAGVDEETTGGGAQEQAIDLGTLLAAADVEAGKKVAKKCVTCHVFEKGAASKTTGPNIWGILGNQYAQSSDFNYSPAFRDLNGGWDYDNLYQFLNKPKAYVPGTKMTFVGLKKPTQVADMIMYLRSLSDNPLPLPEPKPIEPVEMTEESESGADSEIDKEPPVQ